MRCHPIISTRITPQDVDRIFPRMLTYSLIIRSTVFVCFTFCMDFLFLFFVCIRHEFFHFYEQIKSTYRSLVNNCSQLARVLGD